MSQKSRTPLYEIYIENGACLLRHPVYRPIKLVYLLRYVISASRSMCEAACVRLGPIGSYYAYHFDKVSKKCEVVAFSHYSTNSDYDCYVVLISMIISPHSLDYFAYKNDLLYSILLLTL